MKMQNILDVIDLNLISKEKFYTRINYFLFFSKPIIALPLVLLFSFIFNSPYPFAIIPLLLFQTVLNLSNEFTNKRIIFNFDSNDAPNLSSVIYFKLYKNKFFSKYLNKDFKDFIEFMDYDNYSIAYVIKKILQNNDESIKIQEYLDYCYKNNKKFDFNFVKNDDFLKLKKSVIYEVEKRIIKAMPIIEYYQNNDIPNKIKLDLSSYNYIVSKYKNYNEIKSELDLNELNYQLINFLNTNNQDSNKITSLFKIFCFIKDKNITDEKWINEYDQMVNHFDKLSLDTINIFLEKIQFEVINDSIEKDSNLVIPTLTIPPLTIKNNEEEVLYNVIEKNA